MDERLVSQGKSLIALFEQAEVDLAEYKRDRTEKRSAELDKLIERISANWIEFATAGEGDPVCKPRLKKAAILLRVSIEGLRELKTKSDQGIDDEEKPFRARHMYQGCAALVSRLREELVYVISD